MEPDRQTRRASHFSTAFFAWERGDSLSPNAKKTPRFCKRRGDLTPPQHFWPIGIAIFEKKSPRFCKRRGDLTRLHPFWPIDTATFEKKIATVLQTSRGSDLFTHILAGAFDDGRFEFVFSNRVLV